MKIGCLWSVHNAIVVDAQRTKYDHIAHIEQTMKMLCPILEIIHYKKRVLDATIIQIESPNVKVKNNQTLTLS